MSKWEMVKLGECFALSSGKFLPTKKRVHGEYNVFGGNGIIGKHNEYFIDSPTVVIGRVGQYCGCLHTTGKKVWVTDNALYVTRFLKTIDRKYICYTLNQKNLNSFANKSGQPSISQSAILKIEIPLPPLETQKRIAKTLDTAAKLLALRKQQLAELDNLIKATFYDMFGDPVANEKGWEKKFLAELLEDIKYGTSTPPAFSESGFKFIRATNIKAGRIIYNDMKYISEGEAFKIRKCRLQNGDIIIVRSGVNTGDTCVITEEFVGQYAGYDLIIIPNQKLVNSIYLNELINTDYMGKIVKPLTRRAAQPHLNAEQTKKLPIIVPPVELQTQFAQIVSKIEEQKALAQTAIDETQYLFDSLMSEYFE